MAGTAACGSIREYGRIFVAYVAPQGPAASCGPQSRRRDSLDQRRRRTSLAEARQKLAAGNTSFEIGVADGRVLRWLSASGPPRSVPVHATQLYSAIDAGLLALVLWFFFPFRRHDGEVFALLITVHPISRFFLEMIRRDEPGQFGTSLTISQWLSLAILALSVALWIYIERSPRNPPLPAAGA